MPKPIHPSNIPGIAPSSVELLEAVGYDDVAALLTSDHEVLHTELVKANRLLQLADEDPTAEQVVEWIYYSADLLGKPLPESIAGLVVLPGEDASKGEPQEEQPAQEDKVPVDVVDDGPRPVNYETSPEVQAMLAGSPFALPMPARLLMENQVSVSQIPAGIMLNYYVGDLDVRVNQSAPQAPDPGSLGYSSQVFHEQKGHGLDVSRVKTAAEQQQLAQGPPAMRAPSPEDDRISLIRTTRDETNKGRNPESRWFIRGVLHTNPISMYLGAFATLCITILMPASVIAAALLILSSEMAEQFDWVPSWLVWIPAALFVDGMLYLFFGAGARCRVCNQKLFIHRPHLKNSKAHRFPGLGFVVPLCLHILVFRWFRCTHCGTSIRLKE